MRKIFVFFWLMLLFLFSACDIKRQEGSVAEGVMLEMKYSDLLSLTQCDGYVYAQIKNPWDSTAMLHSYVLVEKGKELPADMPKGDVVRIPLDNSVVYTSVHCSLVDELGAYAAIKGVCDLQYIDIDKLQQDCKAGKIVNLGESVSPDIEAVIDISPDAILLSPFQNSGTYGKLGKLGIPIVECADYMETSAMGRAEWMKFYGLLYGCREHADSLFAEIEKDYNSLKAIAASAKHKPSVIVDLKFGSSWYVAGGNSTVGRILADAGADYIFKDEKAQGSVPYAPEMVFDRGCDAEFWVMKYNQETDKTYDEIASEYSSYTQIKAFKDKNVYACNTRHVAFYEETPFHPNLLLRDYIKVFHPELLKDYKLRYYSKLKN